MFRRRVALSSASSPTAALAEQCVPRVLDDPEGGVSHVQSGHAASVSETPRQHSITSVAQLSPQVVDELLEMLAVRLRSTSGLQRFVALSVSQDASMGSAPSVEQRLMPTGSAADESLWFNGSSGQSRSSSDTRPSQWHGTGTAADDGSCQMVHPSVQQRATTSSGAHGGSWQVDGVDWSRGRGDNCRWQWHG